MIIPNGILRFKEKVKNGFDPKTGYPIKAEAKWGAPIPCQVYNVEEDRQAMTSPGEAKATITFDILIEAQPLPDSEQIKVAYDTGEEIGEFSVKSILSLRAVRQIKLSV